MLAPAGTTPEFTWSSRGGRAADTGGPHLGGMNLDIAIVCRSCRTATIFSPDATYPRRCSTCAAIVGITRPDDRGLRATPAELAGSPRARSA
ncbi:MAG: hypothetical protein HYV09_13445 [Deltaproteobacteria bacterium]|nr:hypothetical protein [Deltaproteobacteria bacterium]